MMLQTPEWTNEDIIQTKIEAFMAGSFSALDLFPKQIRALEVLSDDITKELLYGGAAGGGKSFTGCEWLLWNCLAYPGTRWFIGRKHLAEIRKSTIVTFKKVCRKHGIPADWYKYNENAVKIVFNNGSVIEGLDLMHKPGDTDFDGLGSTEYTGGWIEEAGGVAVKAYEVLKTRIGRHMNDEYGIKPKLFITCNPSKNWLYHIFYLPWKNGTLSGVRSFIQAFATDNTKRESGYLEQLEELTGAIRARLLVGDWDYDDDPLALIEYTAIVDLFTNDYLYADEGKRRLICDVALYGSDLFRIGVFYGDVLVEHAYFPKTGGKQIVTEIKKMQAKHQIRAAHILYDADGVGGFIGKEGGFIPGAVAFHGNASPMKRKIDKFVEYANLKAQCGYLLAEKINEGQMWAKAVVREEDREALSEELAQIKRDKATSDGKLRLRKKELIIQDLGRSPDFSDLFLMKQYFDISEAVKRPRHERPIGSY
jgi:phage terminase large subunit